LKLSNKDGNFFIDSHSGQGSKIKETTPNPSKESGSLEQDPWIVIKSFKSITNRVIFID